MNRKFLILLIKGRNLKDSLFFFKSQNIFINKKIRYLKRALYLKTNKKNFYFLISKNIDFKKYFFYNLVDFLLIGEDMFMNLNNYNIFYNYKFLKLNIFFISIISNKYYKYNKNLLNKKVYFSTKYFKILKKYLNYKNISFNINKVSGCIENYCILKKTNLIFDVVSSGNTIIENKVFEIKKVMLMNNLMIYNLNIIYNKIFKFLENKYVK